MLKATLLLFSGQQTLRGKDFRSNEDYIRSPDLERQINCHPQQRREFYCFVAFMNEAYTVRARLSRAIY